MSRISPREKRSPESRSRATCSDCVWAPRHPPQLTQASPSTRDQPHVPFQGLSVFYQGSKAWESNHAHAAGLPGSPERQEAGFGWDLVLSLVAAQPRALSACSSPWLSCGVDAQRMAVPSPRASKPLPLLLGQGSHCHRAPHPSCKGCRVQLMPCFPGALPAPRCLPPKTGWERGEAKPSGQDVPVLRPQGHVAPGHLHFLSLPAPIC